MKENLNIVLYASGFLPALGGREFVVHYLADALLKLGHHVRVVGPAGFLKQRNLRFRYPVHRWPTLRGLLPEQVAVTSLFLDIRLWGCDIIHAHNTYPTGYFASLKRKHNCPLVITPHGEDIQSIPELGHGLMLNPVLNKKIKYALAEAELVTAISRNIEKELINAGAAREKIRLIPNGVDIDRYSRRKEDSSIKAWLGIPPESRIVVTVGRYNPRKGHEYAIRAMPKVIDAEQRACLVIVGNKTEVLKPLIKQLNLDGKVILTGGISPSMGILNRVVSMDEMQSENDYLADLLGCSELYVSAGIDQNAEGLSLAILEAMAAGLPVVATDISGNRDVVIPGENGYLAKAADSDSLADGIIKVLIDESIQKKMRENARKAAMEYDWMNIAQRYVDAYQEAIAIKQASASPQYEP